MARELAGGLKRVIPGSITYRNPDIKGANFSLLRVFIFGLVSSSLLSSCSEKSDGTAQTRQDNTGASKSFRGLRPVSSAAPSFGSSAGDYSPFSEVSNLVDAWNDLQAQGFVGLELGAAQEKLIRKITEEVGVAKACDVLMLVKGPGSDRSKLMEIAFAYSDEDGETLLSEASALASPDDRKAAANALNHNESLSHLDFKGVITDFPAEIQDLFIKALRQICLSD